MTVDDYIAALPDFPREVMTTVRQRIHEAVPGLGERITYNMPAFTQDDTVVLHLAAWKHHLGMYPVNSLSAELETDVAPFRSTKDTVRFRYRDAIPYEIIVAVAIEVVRRRGSADPGQ